MEGSHAQAYSNLAFLSLLQQVPSFQNRSQTENCFEECLQFVGITEATMQLIDVRLLKYTHINKKTAFMILHSSLTLHTCMQCEL